MRKVPLFIAILSTIVFLSHLIKYLTNDTSTYKVTEWYHVVIWLILAIGFSIMYLHKKNN